MHNTLTITYEGENVIAQRTMEKLDEKEPNDNIVFIEGDINVKPLDGGGLEISKKSKEV